MNKNTAIAAIQFLDRATIKGHKERESMNAVCDALLVLVNVEPPKEEDGKTDPE